MGRKKKFELEEDFYEGFSVEELKSTIVNNVRQIKRLNSELKDYRGGVNDTVAELEARNEAALEQIDRAASGVNVA